MKKRQLSIALAAFLTASAVAPAAGMPVSAASSGNTVFINEVESDDPNGGNDWIEIVNTGDQAVDISGWFVTDDKGLERLTSNETKQFPDGTVLEAGAVMVLEDSIDFSFGLGKSDTVSLYNANSSLKDTYSYDGHALGTYSRVPDGTGEFVDQSSTKGAVNVTAQEPGEGENGEYGQNMTALVINEINSSPDDWVELMNTGNETIDLSGCEIRDNSDDHRWRFPEGSTIEPGALLVVDAKTMGRIYNDQTDTFEENTFEAAIGIGSADSIRLYDSQGTLLDEYSWTEHASYEGDAAQASYGRYPDGTGAFALTKETKGQANEWYAPSVVINEVESNGDSTDWVEIKNTGDTAVDISGWYLYDNDPVGHASDITPVAEGTILNPGEYYVFEGNRDFSFGLGNEDKVSIYNSEGAAVAEYSWTTHAAGVYARIPDGTGELTDFQTSTKGEANLIVNPVVLNEVQSNDPDGGADWVELANPTQEALDVSGIVIKDNDDSHEYVIPEGTTIPADGYLVIDDLNFGLGSDDSVRLYEDGNLIANTTWTGHTSPTWGLYPDVNGQEYRNTQEATPGAANKFADIPEVIAWPGAEEVTVFDTESTFLEDSSGLDFFGGQLYAVDNGTGKFWILDVAKEGTLSFANGFEEGKRIRFQKDASDPSAAGPDAEGITVDGAGLVYIASERDNSQKGINYNSILVVDPDTEGSDLTAVNEWDLTSSLPQVSANMGIEAVEWVSDTAVTDKLFDQNTGAAFDPADYPDAVADGVFFVALEDNGHVYAYVLNEDGTSVQIADIDSKLGGAMSLDYDTYENVLWVMTDDGYGNRGAKITLNGTGTPEIVHVLPPSGVDTSANNEGFAIADASYTVNGQRPVYRFRDGVTSGAMTVGSLNCDYSETSGDDGQQTGGNQQTGDNQQTGGNQNSGDKNAGGMDAQNQNSADQNKTAVSESDSGTKAPKTGDSSNILLWAGAAVISLGGVISGFIMKKRHFM